VLKTPSRPSQTGGGAFHGFSPSTKKTGKPWTNDDLKQLKTLVKGNTPTRVIDLKLGRTEASVYSKTHREGISLAPTNRSPRD
jgi:hypothetical protein